MLHLKLNALAILGAGAMLTAACGDDDTKTPGADTSTDTTADTNGAQDTQPDAETTRPLGNVFRIDPLTTPATEVVELEHLLAPYSELTGPFARVRSCTPDKERGEEVPLDLGGFSLNLTTCVPESVARPGADGTYLQYQAPAGPADDDGAFSEVMMYHHMQVIHDYYKDIHGLTDRDEPLDAITNVQAHVDLCDEWAKIANAAFIPEEALDQLPFGLDFGLTGDAIVFSGTATRNFSFDAAVIYHEYTHAMLGATRLNAVFADAQGLNNLPGALNEAYADYFSVAITNDSAVGNYALNDLGEFAVCGFPLGGGGNMARDMANVRMCPEDMTAQVHADSEIFSSALWLIRDALGPTDADRVILAGVLSLTNASDFQIAADATIDATLDILGADAETKVRAAFDARTIDGCSRVLAAERVGLRGTPLSIEPNNAFEPNPFPGYTPGYLQISFEVPAGATAVELALTVAGQGQGQGAPNLELALKPGNSPVTYQYGFGAGSVTHDAALTIPVVGGKAVLQAAPGEVLNAGTWVLATHNKGDAGSINAVTVKDVSPTPEPTR